MNFTPTNQHLQRILLGGALLASAGLTQAQTAPARPANPAPAETAIRLQEFEVTEPRTSAQSMAPTEARLEATQPESIINLQTIQNSIAPTADYAMIAALAPSVTNFSTNGPGLNESKPTLRGFTDGNYNVTIDGVPFGDGNDFTHHTTSYFPAKLLGRVTVDRGPGTASTIGMATFGGTMALETKDPRTEASFVPTLSYGSWKTRLAHFEANTGLLDKANKGSLITSYQYMDTDGYRTFGTLRRNTYFFKYIQPIGKEGKTTLTFMGEYNNIKFNNPNRTLTGQDIITLGRNFGQVSDPLDRNGDYYGNNYQVKQTDTGFIALDSDLGGNWKLTDKVYTFSYNNSSHESPANNGGATIVAGKTVAGTDLAGRFKVNSVRAVGDTLAVSHADDFGTFKVGTWFDYQHGPRYQIALDYNVANAQKLGMVATPSGYLDPLAPSTKGGYVYNMHFFTRTWEPYVEYAWRPIQNLTFTPGVKYMWIERSIEAPINQTKNLLPAFYNQVYAKTLPVILANYRLASNWSAYAQFATGMLTPPLAFFQEDNPQKNIVEPQTTTNYQLGTVYKTNRFNADFDGYFIRSHNLPVTILNPDTNYTDPTTGKTFSSPNDTITYTAHGAYYYGLEAQGTFYVGAGLSVFANGSRNYGTYEKSKRRIEGVPQSTMGTGLIYDHSGFFASVMAKYSGQYTVTTSSASPDQALTPGAVSYVQGGYTMCDLSLGYGAKLQRGGFLKSYKARLQINNAFDRNVVLIKSVKATAGAYNPLTSTFNPLTPRGYFLTVSTEF